ncbi:YybH family protein [Flavobacterium sp. UBA6135]|uniref:YybH family protein n=1 Tax=Flavobacterium sp. UBA6135 TaxID=1946553 RepID=UPI0025B8AB35|nr:nuclear transport factor 2 family protein [Flavobacterium sp. UBA6135]
MKQKFLKPMTLGICMLLMVACNTKSEAPVEEAPAVDADAIRTEIQTLEDAYAAASNSRDVDGIMTYYSDDAISYPSEKAPVVGKEAMKASIQEDLVSYPKGSTVSFAVKDLFISDDGTLVTEIGSYTALDSLGNKTRTGHYMSLFEKRDGKYVCIRDISTPDTPLMTKQ